MNKKRLSVVMAGAMLASSVAPVLAADAAKSEISASNIGLLVDEISRKIQAAPVFTNTSDTTKVENDVKGKSVYAIQVGDTLKYISKGDTLKLTQDNVKTALGSLTVGTVVKLVNLGYAEEKNGTNSLIVSMESKTTYTENELKGNGAGTLYRTIHDLATGANKAGFTSIVKDYEYVEGTGFVITLKDAVTFYGPEKKLVLTTESNRLDFTHYYAAADKQNSTAFSTTAVTTPATNFYGFVDGAAANISIPNVVEKEFTIKSGGDTFELSDLYDGLMLTEKGQSLLNDAKDTLSIVKKANKDHIVEVCDANGANTDLGTSISLTKDAYGVYRATLKIADVSKAEDSTKPTEYKTYTVTSKDRVALERVLTWFNNISADVDKLAGEDRYETAVRIAKEVASLNTLKTNHSTNKVFNIVLVNGDSLVDGLSAAPLAAKLANDDKQGNAPILLTEKNSLPKATKDYLMSLIDNKANKNVTVSIVGGDGVVSNSVVKELKSMNLKVKRYGGADRQATSMAVAEVVGFDNGAFVVGATGEADAMSVAGVAASEVAPIVVSGFEGLSEYTVQELDGKTVKVIGGEGAVSAEDFKAIKEVTNKVERISGEDRKATNAAVINKFYTALGNSTESVIVAKDDVLIDALTASNLSVVHNSPIVLATNSLTNDQLNAVVKNATNAQNVKKVYQVGHGVDPLKVVKVIAESLGLA